MNITDTYGSHEGLTLFEAVGGAHFKDALHEAQQRAQYALDKRVALRYKGAVIVVDGNGTDVEHQERLDAAMEAKNAELLSKSTVHFTPEQAMEALGPGGPGIRGTDIARAVQAQQSEPPEESSGPERVSTADVLDRCARAIDAYLVDPEGYEGSIGAQWIKAMCSWVATVQQDVHLQLAREANERQATMLEQQSKLAGVTNLVEAIELLEEIAGADAGRLSYSKVGEWIEKAQELNS